MADPRLNPGALASAAISNTTLASRLGWATKRGSRYANASDPKLVVSLADYQESETAQGRRLTIDGVLGPKTLQAIRNSMARAAAGAVAAGAAGAFFGVPGAAGAAGADEWGAHWSQNITIGAPAKVEQPAEQPPAPVVIIPEVEPVLPPIEPPSASGGGMGPMLALLGLAAGAWAVFG